ncbi:hypothetical protein AOCH_005953 [Aspergillus ochraceoroseus]|uniref:SAM-dependent MTase RsmB/NOP-type domain-containing protein n=1 Tax=Aspergillus ochraceoroseus TaxID=138278 RepID=A0A0F8U409_9EURO|nr:hypothetical protein AOCH_005953 [Aspergillus ochraceoroseus]
MSLYYDAVAVLTAPSSTGGSFKSRLYNSRTLKAAPAQIYALIVEAAKWDILLKEVIEHAGILKTEPKLSPLLAILLVHDQLLAKNGIAATAPTPFVKRRVRRGCATIPELKETVRKEKLALQGADGPASAAVYPRWVRVNNVRTTLEAQLESSLFASYGKVETLSQLVDNQREEGKGKGFKMRLDPHVPDLIAVPPGVEFTTSSAYKNGEIILQDKASCFPAYLLLGDKAWDGGDLLDGCAAPGNKTTHLASLLYSSSKKTKKKNKEKEKEKAPSSRIYSMDASKVRAKTLQKMVSTAGADKITTVLPGQDFLALDPEDPRFENVTGLLLDPSCSGSGIIGRDDVPKFVLPAGPSTGLAQGKNQGKKRKRNESDEHPSRNNASPESSPTDENELTSNTPMDPERLTKLSNLQTRIVEHALSFPAATRITYSTCSIHMIENESVVERILSSEVAKRRGWRIMRRDEQPRGLREWKRRGIRAEESRSVDLSDEELDACLRCWPGDDEGTGGFFVAGFVRDSSSVVEKVDDVEPSASPQGNNFEETEEDAGEEWEGFSD